MKGTEAATDPAEIDRWEGGVGWIAHPEETMRRASHALRVGDEVWVVDPVDADGVDDLVSELGEVAGVVVLLDRHARDAAALARRHGVSVHLPAWIDREFDAPVERFEGELAETGYRSLRIVDFPLWGEAALFDGETLVVADAVGTADYFLAAGERLGVNPALRLLPPRRALSGLAPERVLVGHGAGVFEDAAGALDDALRGARWRAPGLYAKNLRSFLPV